MSAPPDSRASGQRFLDRNSDPHLVTLILVTATGAVAMNVFLPSLPGMARYFEADYAVVQLSVSLFLAGIAVLQIFVGPLSDRYGRRPVLIWSFLIFLAGTVAAIFAPTIEILLVCRMVQTFSAAGMVLSRAIVRDTVETSEAASRIGYITMAMSLAPMIGPIIGGYLDEIYDWRANFWLTFAFGAIALVFIWFDLGETNRSPSPSFTAQFAAYPELMRSRRFWGYGLSAAFTSGAFFAFLGGGPYVATEQLGASPSQYGLYFGLVAGGYMLGNYFSGRYSRSVGMNRMMLFGSLTSTVGMLLALALFAGGLMHPFSLFVPVFFTGIGNGMTLPSANTGIVSVRPRLAGSASGLGGSMQIGGGAVLAMFAGALLGPETGPYPLIWVMLISSLCAVLATLYVMHVARTAGEI